MAKKSGVKYILNVGYDLKSNQIVIEQLEQFPNLFGAIGLHPNDGKSDFSEENLILMEKQLVNKKIIAIGEIELAKKYNLPVLLHIRGEENEEIFIEAFNDAYRITKEAKIEKGILHCFTGT
ncbi:11528_t:CDS:2 [Ambispora leptoticha]|uniref:11528_t:CDS:1 n=1 Tax=Ambispora leptoticha TaxID=144679 RepID=A0A9N8YQD2_9GLOM|nr:11528_t:CDS:2 [Ambispora leptoticha]